MMVWWHLANNQHDFYIISFKSASATRTRRHSVITTFGVSLAELQNSPKSFVLILRWHAHEPTYVATPPTKLLGSLWWSSNFFNGLFTAPTTAWLAASPATMATPSLQNLGSVWRSGEFLLLLCFYNGINLLHLQLTFPLRHLNLWGLGTPAPYLIILVLRSAQ